METKKPDALDTTLADKIAAAMDAGSVEMLCKALGIESPQASNQKRAVFVGLTRGDGTK